MQASRLPVLGSGCQRCGPFVRTQTQVGPPRGQREQRPLGRESQSCSSDRSAERLLRGAAQCFVLITSEMLTWASLGAARGDQPHGRWRRFCKQRGKPKSASAGERGPAGLERGHSLCQEGGRKTPQCPGTSSLAARAWPRPSS